MARLYSVFSLLCSLFGTGLTKSVVFVLVVQVQTSLTTKILPVIIRPLPTLNHTHKTSK